MIRFRLQLVFVGIGLGFLLGIPSFAADDALLRNGFSIRHDHRESVQGGTVTRLYTSPDGSSFVDVPTTDIASFEKAQAESAPQITQPTIAKAPEPEDLTSIVRDASDKHLIDEDLIQSVIRAESSFNRKAVSRKGAQGLMQLMPGTSRNLGVANPFDPRANVEGGTRYLHDLLVRFDFDLVKALAAYNAGPERVELYKGVPPYYETRAYVARIIKDFNRKKIAAGVKPTGMQKAQKASSRATRSKASPAI